MNESYVECMVARKSSPMMSVLKYIIYILKTGPCCYHNDRIPVPYNAVTAWRYDLAVVIYAGNKDALFKPEL